mmetsp:Transcript_149821/g.481240  ORF Transcript_149821/g.481240 Transcript_149821/m.481240 type:complete len:209 (-) Transcript_149821:851-1477(-)
MREGLALVRCYEVAGRDATPARHAGCRLLQHCGRGLCWWAAVGADHRTSREDASFCGRTRLADLQLEREWLCEGTAVGARTSVFRRHAADEHQTRRHEPKCHDHSLREGRGMGCGIGGARSDESRDDNPRRDHVQRPHQCLLCRQTLEGGSACCGRDAVSWPRAGCRQPQQRDRGGDEGPAVGIGLGVDEGDEAAGPFPDIHHVHRSC